MLSVPYERLYFIKDKIMIFPSKNRKKIPFRHSLRLRILGLVVVFVIGITGLMSFYILRQFEDVTILELEHEGILLSNALEAVIGSLAKVSDIHGIQDYINRLVKIRGRSDLEINIMLIQGDKSAVVASNDPENIEENSRRDHVALLDALKHKQPVVYIGRDDADRDEDINHPSSLENTPPHGPLYPDYYFLPDQRFLSITTPLFDSDSKLGCINIKLSLASLDQKLGIIRKGIFLASLFGVIVILVSLSFLLNFQVIKPLWEMAENIVHIGSTDLNRRLSITGRNDEFGILAQEFNQMLDRIRTLVGEMREMTDNIAHDLRSPITRIRGAAEITLTTGISLDEYKVMAANTIEECDNVLNIINTMLYISKTEAGVDNIEKKEVDISGIIRNACELFQPIADDKSITIVCNVPDECCVLGNVHMLQRMVANLLDNALKYTPAGGKVEISIKGDEKRILISFADNGIGISKDDIIHIFKRFYRCDKSRSKPGIGLGLSLTRAIAKSHGGDVSVSSILNRGTTFTVALPR
jgi:signal transduction histidine kinase